MPKAVLPNQTDKKVILTTDKININIVNNKARKRAYLR